MKDRFAAGDLKTLDIELLQDRFLNKSVFGIVLIEGGNAGLCSGPTNRKEKCRLCFSYFSDFSSRDKLVKSGPGYLCVFEKSFLSGLLRERVLKLPMFTPGSSVEYVLSEQDYEKVSHLFLRIIQEQNSSYQYKFDLIRTYLTQLLHLVMKMGEEAVS